MSTITPFQWPVLVYLVLSGCSCGLALTAAATLWTRCEEQNRLGFRAAVWSALTILVGAGMLIADLEDPKRWAKIVEHFNPGSWVAIGARVLVFHAVATLAVVASTRLKDGGEGAPAPRLLLTALLLSGLAVGVYPALLLGQSAAMRPLWGSEWLAPLWLVSGVHGGLALLSLLVAIAPLSKEGVAGLSDGQLRAMDKVDALLIVIQAALLAVFFHTLGQRPGAWQLASGPLLWVGVVLGGWLLPLLEMSRPERSRGRLFLRSVLVLAGAVAFRAAFFYGGQHPAALMGA